MKSTSVFLLALTLFSSNSYSMNGQKIECDLRVSEAVVPVLSSNASKSFDFKEEIDDWVSIEEGSKPEYVEKVLKGKMEEFASKNNRSHSLGLNQTEIKCLTFFQNKYPRTKYSCPNEAVFEQKSKSLYKCEKGKCFYSLRAELTAKGYLGSEKTIEEMKKEKCKKIEVCLLQNSDSADTLEIERIGKLKDVICSGDIALESKSSVGGNVNNSSRKRETKAVDTDSETIKKSSSKAISK